MFGSSILEVAIGVVFIYLIFALICSAINEWISSLLSRRAHYLEKGIKNLLNDPSFTGLAQQLYNHGLVDAISEDSPYQHKATIKPGYMAASTFSLALLDILGARGVGASVEDLQKAADAAELRWKTAEEAAAIDPSHRQDAEQARTAFDRAKAELDAAHEARAQASQATIVADAYAVITGAIGKHEIKDAQGKLAAVRLARQKDPPEATEEDLAAAQADFDRLTNAIERAGKIKKETFDLLEREGISKIKRLVAWIATWPLMRRFLQDPHAIHAGNKASVALEHALDAARSLAAQHPNPLENLQAGVNGLPHGHTRETLLVLVDKTRRDVALAEQTAQDSAARAARAMEKFKGNIEEWYDTSMDRVGGWYKKWTQKILLAIALALVTVANADTLVLVKRFMRDPTLRASIVAAAQEYAKAKITEQSKTENQNATSAPGPGKSAAGANKDGAKDTNKKGIAPDAAAKLKDLIKEAEGLDLPLGWVPADGDPHPEELFPLSVGGWLLKVLGLFISALAVSLGAPFWFDLLSRFVNLRGAGTPPGETKRGSPKSSSATTETK